MGMQLNTGDTGRAVSPAADGSLYSKIFGSGCYVLSGGNEFKAEIQSNNLIKIYDGDLIMQGRHSYIPASDSDNVTINNGSQGMNRKDLIVARYTKDSTGVEDVTLQVVQGMATSGAATAPGYTDGDILKGATAKDFPLYEVSLTGINITEVKKLFKVLGTNEDLTDKVTELNGNYANNVRFIFFTMTPYGTGNSSALITTITKINSLFGITDATPQNSGAVIMNGDGNADSLHAEGVTWQGENLYAVFNKNVNGRFRITGLLYYSPAGAITLS